MYKVLEFTERYVGHLRAFMAFKKLMRFVTKPAMLSLNL